MVPPAVFFLSIVFISTILFSCSTFYQSGFQRSFSLQEIEAILSDAREQEESVSSFYTFGHIMVKGWVWDSEADILIAGIKDPFQLKIEITHPWGKPILHLLIDEEKLEVLSFKDKTVYLGNFTPEALSTFLPGVMADPDLIWSVLRGYPHLIHNYQIEDHQGGQIILYNQQEAEIIDLDSESLLPRRVSFPNRKIHLTFSEIRCLNNVCFAGEVRVEHDSENKNLVIQNEKMVFNTTIPKQIFVLKKPPLFETVFLD